MTTLQQLLEESEREYKKFECKCDRNCGELKLQFSTDDVFTWHKSQIERAYQLGRGEQLLAKEK